MGKDLVYSFDDEVVSKFCYDIDNKIIEIYFKGYYDITLNQYINKDCVWVIENWSEAKSKLVNESKFFDLNMHLGVFSMILQMELQERKLELIINTIDNRYITLIFFEPKISLRE